MECNVGGVDRAVRVALAVAGLGFGLFGRLGALARIAALLVGSSATLTASTGYCPLNQALGLNTCRRRVILLPESLPQSS